MDTVLHTLILTPSTVEEAAREATLARIEQFISLQEIDPRQRHVAIFFLNSETTFQKATRHCRIDAFVALQTL